MVAKHLHGLVRIAVPVEPAQGYSTASRFSSSTAISSCARKIFVDARPGSPRWACGILAGAEQIEHGSSMAELDGFNHEQHCADDEVATQGEHAESGTGRPFDGLQQRQRRHPPGGAVDSGDRV
jgi:hypothetical protein